MNVINSFSGEYDFLSNFYPEVIVYEGAVYSCVEGAYQAAKCLNPEDRKQFTNLNGYQAKKLGRHVKLREDWEDVKVGVMYTCLQYKFLKHPSLANKLLATGDTTLIEGNYWNDTFWGVCNGVGKNHLGELLMQIRKELKSSTPLGKKELSEL